MIVDFVFIAIFIALGFVFPTLFESELNRKDKQNLKNLWLFHLSIGVYFCFFVFGDAIGYWRASKNLTFDNFVHYLFEAKGTYFIYSFNYFPSAVLDLSYFSGTILYCLFGYIGLVFFYIVSIKSIPYNSTFRGYRLMPLVFFIPNLHFWSVGIGKDTLLFLCIGMFSYAILNISKRIPLLFLSLILSYLIRPHITLFLLVGFAFGYLFTSKIPLFKRMVLIMILIAGGLIILPAVMQFAKIEEASVESFNQFSENKVEALSGSNTGSAIDISSYPFPLKVATFLYRPFFFDIRGIPAIIASFENLLLLLLTIQVFKSSPLDTFKAAPLAIKGLLFFLIIGTLAFSQSLGNVGIMIRMRNMFLPGMLIYILWSFSYQQQVKLNFLKTKKKVKTAIP